MMTSILTDLGKSIAEKLMNLAITESRYICCFGCYVDSFEKEKEKLKPKRATVREYIGAAKRRNEVIRPDVSDWNERADKLIEEDTKTKKTCFLGLCSNCKWRYQRGKELEEMTKEITSLMQNNFERDGVGLSPLIPGVEYHSFPFIHFKDRESKYKELKEALMDDNNYITGLQGMGGTGKTTLATQVGKELQKLKFFDHVVDTTVSYTPKIETIQDDIAGPLGLQLKNYNESERPKQLWSRLRNNEEKILVILDDVWGPIDFEKIGIPSEGDHNGCRVLLTTRYVHVCNSMGCERGKIIQLDLLSDEDSWTLFQKHAGISDHPPKHLLQKGREIVKECQGLPVAIAAIASTLKGQQSREKWDVALKSLKKPMPMHGVDKDMTRFYKCLRYAYDDMKDEKTKELFLLCSVFHEDEEISTKILTRYSVAMGFFGEVEDKYDDFRSQVVVAKNELVDSCLLLKDEVGRAKMHDLVREAAQWIADKEIQVVKLYNKNNKSSLEREKNIRYLSCEGKSVDIFSCNIESSKLKILIVSMYDDDATEFLNTFLENMTELRVFHLSRLRREKMSDLSLPKSIQVMMNIRSLIFENLVLGNISIIGTLQSLETLDLVRCEIFELPHIITELEKLTLMKLYDCSIRENDPFEVIVKCSSLEELYFVSNTYNPIKKNITLHALQRYHFLEYSSEDKEDLVSRFVSLQQIDDLFSEATFKYLMQTSEILQLSDTKRGWRNLIPEIVPTNEGMNDLLEIDLRECPNVECLIETKDVYSNMQNVFSKLVVLRLIGMQNLEALCIGPLPLDFLKSLKELELHDCEQLKSLVTVERRDENREEIAEDIDSGYKRYGSPLFPCLKTLFVVRCHQLDFILPILSAGCYPQLEAILIDNCEKLKYVFGEYQHEHDDEDQNLPQDGKNVVLGSLKVLSFDTLPNLIDIFPKCHHPMKRSKSCSRDDSVIQLEPDHIKSRHIFPWLCCCYTPKLTTSQDHQQHKEELRSFSSPTCPSSPKTCRIMLPLLTHFYLYSCPQLSLTSIGDLMLPLHSTSKLLDNTNIKELSESMMNLPLQEVLLGKETHMMYPFVGSKNYLALQNLEKLIIQDCEKVEVVFSASVLKCLPQLYGLYIKNCKELKQIIEEEEEEDDNSPPKTCFPKLRVCMVKNCNKLKCVFPFSTSKEFPKLEELWISKAPELEGIFGCEQSNNNNKKVDEPLKEETCFPELNRTVVFRCNKLKCVFPAALFSSVSKEFPKLEFMLIKEASELEQVFRGCENEVGFPNLKVVAFVQLPSLRISHGIELQAQKGCYVRNCPRLSLTSTLTVHMLRDFARHVYFVNAFYSRSRYYYYHHVLSKVVDDELKFVHSEDTNNQNPTEETPEIPEASALPPSDDNTKQSTEGNQAEHNQHEIEFISNEIIKTDETLEAGKEHVKKVSGQDIPCPSPVDNSLQQTHSHDLLDQQLKGEEGESCLMNQDQQQPLGETDNIPHGNNCPEETKDQSIHEVSNSKNTETAIPLANPETRKKSPERLLTSAQRNNESSAEGTASKSGKIITSPTHSKSVSPSPVPFASTSGCKTDTQVDGDGQTVTPSFSVATAEHHTSKDVDVKDSQKTTKTMLTLTETNAPTSINDDDSMKLSSRIKEQISKDADTRISQSKPSTSFTSPIAPHSPTLPMNALIGNQSQIVKDSNIASLVKEELEQLVSKKHLAPENLTLLNDFLVKYPSVRLMDNALGSKYKGCAYNCLAELLKFLQTHSVSDVSGSSHADFVELLQDARNFGFDKEWLDAVERRAFLPGLLVFQDTLQELSHSKRILTQHVEDLKQQLASSEAILESIFQQEAQVLEARVALSVPLGY